MKKINKKGFTLTELMAVILVIGIVFSIAIPSVSYVIKASKKRAYRSHEDVMKKAAIAYLTQNSNSIPINEEECFLDVSFLINNKYIKAFKDPDNSDLNCIDGSFIIVKRSDKKDDNDNYINISLNYIPYLNCSRNEKPAGIIKPTNSCNTGAN